MGSLHTGLYQIARLRITQGLPQSQLAELVDTRQPRIARLESGKAEPSISFLRRVVTALGGRLEIQIFMPEEVPRVAQVMRLR